MQRNPTDGDILEDTFRIDVIWREWYCLTMAIHFFQSFTIPECT